MPGRKHMVYQGGGVFANLIKDDDNSWVSKQEYEEQVGSHYEFSHSIALLQGVKRALAKLDHKS